MNSWSCIANPDGQHWTQWKDRRPRQNRGFPRSGHINGWMLWPWYAHLRLKPQCFAIKIAKRCLLCRLILLPCGCKQADQCGCTDKQHSISRMRMCADYLPDKSRWSVRASENENIFGLWEWQNNSQKTRIFQANHGKWEHFGWKQQSLSRVTRIFRLDIAIIREKPECARRIITTTTTTKPRSARLIIATMQASRNICRISMVMAYA